MKILQTIKDQQNSWQLVEPILNHSSVHDTIFFALLLLESMVKKNWRALSLEDKQCILRVSVIYFNFQIKSPSQICKRNFSKNA